jgi:hypothetical protein
LGRLVPNPVKVRGASVGHRDYHEFGEIVGMQLGESGSDGGHTIACGLDDELPLDIALDSTAPAEE